MKPREKMALCGAENLSDEELLTLLIGSGTSGLSAREIAAALEIAAGFELSRRALREIHAAPYIKGSSNPTAAHQAAQPEEDYIFNERDLNYYWPVSYTHLNIG